MKTMIGKYEARWLPYLFHSLEHTEHKHVWLPLGRNYKPIGCTETKSVKYQDYIHQAIRFKSDPRELKDVWAHSAPDHFGPGWNLFLYGNSSKDYLTYFDRLERLLKTQ